MSNPRKFTPLLWTLAFLLLFNVYLSRITRFQELPVVSDHRGVTEFSGPSGRAEILVLGSSRVRSFRPLEESLAPGTLLALPVSGGGLSTLLELYSLRLAPKFKREARWPREVWLGIQPSDFHETNNYNSAAVVWGWTDFLMGLADGIDDRDRNFLQPRVYDWFSWFAPVIDRNERSAFPSLLEAWGLSARAAERSGQDRAAASAQSPESVDDRELDAFFRMVSALRSKGVAVKVIRMPLSPVVEALQDSAANAALDGRLRALCDGTGAAYLEFDSGRLGLSAADFGPDLIHLHRDGEEKFSRAMADRLLGNMAGRP